MDIDKLLTERKSVHGDFNVQFECAQRLKAVVKDYGYHSMKQVPREALEMILVKISRIVTGDPAHADHWTDLAGYASLIAKELTPPTVPLLADLIKQSGVVKPGCTCPYCSSKSENAYPASPSVGV